MPISPGIFILPWLFQVSIKYKTIFKFGTSESPDKCTSYWFIWTLQFKNTWLPHDDVVPYIMINNVPVSKRFLVSFCYIANQTVTENNIKSWKQILIINYGNVCTTWCLITCQTLFLTDKTLNLWEMCLFSY